MAWDHAMAKDTSHYKLVSVPSYLKLPEKWYFVNVSTQKFEYQMYRMRAFLTSQILIRSYGTFSSMDVRNGWQERWQNRACVEIARDQGYRVALAKAAIKFTLRLCGIFVTLVEFRWENHMCCVLHSDKQRWKSEIRSKFSVFKKKKSNNYSNNQIYIKKFSLVVFVIYEPNVL